MKNNKGFSLVELIIVIAILAILVGVMAPQLIKYIEKTNVSSDAQLCDSIRSAVQTSMLDPTVIASSSAGIPSDSSYAIGDFPTGACRNNVEEILGTSLNSISSQIKSHVGSSKASGLTVKIENGNNVTVFLATSDATGKKCWYWYLFKLVRAWYNTTNI